MLPSSVFLLKGTGQFKLLGKQHLVLNLLLQLRISSREKKLWSPTYKERKEKGFFFVSWEAMVL